jgi:hypothetical protein
MLSAELEVDGDGRPESSTLPPSKALSTKEQWTKSLGEDPFPGPFSGTDGISPNEYRVHTGADPRQSVSSLDA